MKPLYGHTSQDTAYFVSDYPYGFRLRCTIRYWIEHDPKRGFRFCSQTTNPKRSNAWNTPKHSTYAKFAACMYLDDDNHVTWSGVNEYTDPDKVAEFCRNFPSADLSIIADWATVNACNSDLHLSGDRYMTMNGQKIEPSAEDLARYVADAKNWREVAALCGRQIPI